MDDVRRSAPAQVEFLVRQMYENYLLHPKEISTVLEELGLNATPEKVRKELESLAAQALGVDNIPEDWRDTVNGARLLSDLFRMLSGGTITYEKCDHGVRLTTAILRDEPEFLRPMAALIEGFLAQEAGRNLQER